MLHYNSKLYYVSQSVVLMAEYYTEYLRVWRVFPYISHFTFKVQLSRSEDTKLCVEICSQQHNVGKWIFLCNLYYHRWEYVLRFCSNEIKLYVKMFYLLEIIFKYAELITHVIVVVLKNLTACSLKIIHHVEIAENIKAWKLV